MTALINQYSFIILGVFVVLTVAFVCWRFGGLKYVPIAFGLIFVLLLVSQVLLRTNSSTYSTVASFEDVLESKKPIFLELYSNF